MITLDTVMAPDDWQEIVERYERVVGSSPRVEDRLAEAFEVAIREVLRQPDTVKAIVRYVWKSR